MFFKPSEPLHVAFDEEVCAYLIRLAHVKNSITLSIADKSDFIKSAEDISHDIFTSAERIRARGVNNFNKAEVDSTLVAALKRILSSMRAQAKAIDKSVVIDKAFRHSVKEAVDSLVGSGPNLVVFSKDKIDRMFSFRRFFDQVKKPLDVEKETAKLKAQDDGRFYELGLKAFREMLLAPTHSNAERFFYSINLLDGLVTNAKVPFMRRDDLAKGLRFLEADNGRFVIAFTDAYRDVEVRVAMERSADYLSVDISGFIEEDGSRDDFSVVQRYSNSLYDSVIAAFRLRKILEALDRARWKA